MADLEHLRSKNDGHREVFKKIKPLPIGTFQEYHSLEDMFAHCLVGLTQEVALRQSGLKPKESFKKIAIAVSGPTIAGKTFIRTIMRESLEERMERLSLGGRIHLGEATWEDDGEESARREGKITTPREVVFNEDELEAANESTEQATAESIRNKDVVLIEVPGGATASMIDGKWVGRQLGAKLLYNLEGRTGNFRDLPDYDVFHVGLIGSPLLRFVNVPFREDYRSTTSLEEAQFLTRMYGKKVPKDIETWHRQKAEGASEAQIGFIESQIDGLAFFLNRLNLITIPGDKEISLEGALQNEVVNYTQDLKTALNQKNSVRPKVVGVLMEYFFRQILHADPNRVFIGYNNPTPKDLKIPDLDLLSQHLRDRRRVI